MFSDIKFNGPLPIDSNGEELSIGDVVFTYAACWDKTTVPMIVVGQSKSNNKYIWVTNGGHLYKRIAKNTILIKHPNEI